jgi:hypothetical protein
MDLTVLLILVWMHFVCDFLLQTDKIASSKSSSNRALSLHVTIYSAPFLVFGWKFAAVTWVLHFVTDYFSSRIASWFYKREQRHWFFVTIGVDQALHMTALFTAYYALA